MRALRTTLLGLLLWSIGWAADGKSAPTMPTEVTLTSGRILRNVKVMGWKKDAVLIKSAAGLETVPFVVIKSLTREALNDIRIAMEAQTKATTASTPPPPTRREVSGQVFVTTRGAGAYKFSGAHIRVFDMADFNHAKEKQENNLPSNFRRMESDQKDAAAANAWVDAVAELREVARTTTDADGNYILALPPGDHFIVCAAGRVISARIREQNAWVVKIPAAGGRLDLNSSNSWVQPE